MGWDVHPDREGHRGIRQADYLAQRMDDLLPTWARGRPLAVIGNPPYGAYANLAIAFLDKALGEADIVSFILPRGFAKWNYQNRVRRDARLIASEDLPHGSVEFRGKPHDIRVCFQVWTRQKTAHPDLRIRERPPTSMPGFRMEVYNITRGAEHLTSDWTLAVQQAGLGEYEIVESGTKLTPAHHWAMFWCEDVEIERRLRSIDFLALARQGTSAKPAFSKGDLVAALSTP